MSGGVEMFAEERQEKIAAMLEEKNSLKVTELAEAFDVSESTIRRDLQEMEQKNLLTRTHGGAVGINQRNFEPTYTEKATENQDAKAHIGDIAAALVGDGDTVILDSGTTTLEIAKRITARNITIVTNSIDIAGLMSERDSVEVVLTGGTLRHNTRAMVGHLAERALSNFRADIAFIGVNGISVEDGATTPNFVEAQTKKAMVNSANKVYAVTDMSKFGKVNFSVISPIRAFNAVITAGKPDAKVLDDFAEAGVLILHE